MGDQQMHILIVEDNKINLMLTKRLVQNLGYAISTAESGVEALEKIKDTDFDLVLTDIQMPLMNGLELAANIRVLEDEIKKRLPIIALTGYAGDDEMHEALNSGVNEILTKPFGPESLDLLIKKLTVG
ncbi:MAG: response regulator [Bacteroidota bacterium]